MLVMVGMVSAAHDTTLNNLPDEWIDPNTNQEFTITLTNNGVNSIWEVRIERPSEYSNLACSDIAGWNINEFTGYCIYSGNFIGASESQDFTFSVDIPTDWAEYGWQVVTEDILGAKYFNTQLVTGPTIQKAIDAATGDTINVPAGTYEEDLHIDIGITLQGAGSSTTIIDGEHTIDTNDVTLDGFTFVVNANEVGINIDSSSSTIDNVVITNNIFDVSNEPVVAIYLGGGTPTNAVTNIVMNDNTFNGPDTVLKACNPWKIGGAYGSPVSAEVTGVDFERNTVNRCSIPINLHTKDITDILINNNTFRNTDGVVYVWGANPTGILSDFVFINNDVDSTNSYGVAMGDGSGFSDTNYGLGNLINNNLFVDIVGAYGYKSVSIVGATSYILDAINNWFGDIDPSDDVSANVEYEPFCYDDVCSADTTDPIVTFNNGPYIAKTNVDVSFDITVSDDRLLSSCIIEFGDEVGDTINCANESSVENVIKTHQYSIENEYTVVVRVTDAAGRETIKTTQVIITDETFDWVINLKEGWNLISIPLTPEDTSINSVLDNIIENVAYEGTSTYTIYQYDATNGKWYRARKYDSNSGYTGPTTYKLTKVVPGYAYWIKMENDDVLYGNEKEYAPNEIPIPSIDLATGKWNLVGKYGKTNTSVEDNEDGEGVFVLLEGNVFLNNILELVSNVWTKVTGDLEAQKGYWIRTKISDQDTIAYEPGSYYFNEA